MDALTDAEMVRALCKSSVGLGFAIFGVAGRIADKRIRFLSIFKGRAINTPLNPSLNSYTRLTHNLAIIWIDQN